VVPDLGAKVLDLLVAPGSVQASIPPAGIEFAHDAADGSAPRHLLYWMPSVCWNSSCPDRRSRAGRVVEHGQNGSRCAALRRHRVEARARRRVAACANGASRHRHVHWSVTRSAGDPEVLTVAGEGFHLRVLVQSTEFEASLPDAVLRGAASRTMIDALFGRSDARWPGTRACARRRSCWSHSPPPCCGRASRSIPTSRACCLATTPRGAWHRRSRANCSPAAPCSCWWAAAAIEAELPDLVDSLRRSPLLDEVAATRRAARTGVLQRAQQAPLWFLPVATLDRLAERLAPEGIAEAVAGLGRGSPPTRSGDGGRAARSAGPALDPRAASRRGDAGPPATGDRVRDPRGSNRALLRVRGLRPPFDVDFSRAVIADLEARLQGHPYQLLGGYAVACADAARIRTT
jgi:hypothetical protein